LLAVNPEWVWTLKELLPLAKENCYVVKYTASFPFPGGKTIEVDGIDLVFLSDKDGKLVIQHNEVYFDRALLMKQSQAKL